MLRKVKPGQRTVLYTFTPAGRPSNPQCYIHLSDLKYGFENGGRGVGMRASVELGGATRGNWRRELLAAGLT